MSPIDGAEMKAELTLEEIGLVMALLDELETGQSPSQEVIDLAASTKAMLRTRVEAAR